MKNIYSSLKKISLVVLATIAFQISHAANFTAVTSGDWSNSSTWGGTAPDNTVLLDNITIPSGITVTITQDVTFNGPTTSLAVNGNLLSTNFSRLIFKAGNLSGNGTMTLDYLAFETTGTMSFTGITAVKKFTNSAIGLVIGSGLGILEELVLEAGSMSLSTGSTLALTTGSKITVNNGTMTVQGGSFTANTYNVEYIGTSKTTGAEISSGSLSNVTISLSGANQTVTLSSNLIVKGILTQQTGGLNLNGFDLTINGNYSSPGTAFISGNVNSSIKINTLGSLSSIFLFNTTSNAIKNIEINIANGSGNMDIGNPITIYGKLSLMSGNLRIVNGPNVIMATGSEIEITEGSIITSAGGLTAISSYNLTYLGGNKSTGAELTGLEKDIVVNLGSPTAMLTLTENLIAKGKLALRNGVLNLNGYNLDLRMDFENSTTASINGNSTSSLTISSPTSFADGIRFTTGSQNINTLTINIANKGGVKIASDLLAEKIILINGSLLLADNSLTINPTGSIIGYTKDQYVMINGNGALKMTVTTAAGFVVFPVGTLVSYSPAHIQKNTGSAAQFEVNTINPVWSNGTTGVDMGLNRGLVQRTWNITSANTTNLDMNLKLGWTQNAEVAPFNRADAYIGHYINGQWDYNAKSAASTQADGTFQLTRNNITQLSPFAVGNELGTGINENQTVINEIYPNPVIDVLNYTTINNQQAIVGIYDVAGKLLRTDNGVQNGETNSIDFSSYPSGIYFVKFSTPTSQTTQKIVKY